MKFIHTSDWHLGRIFYGIHLTEDQAFVLDQLIHIIKDEQPDLFILAGDVYDRAVPPPEAVELLDDVLSRIILDHNVPVILISGNHDNPRRLGFGSRLLKTRGLHLRCSLDQKIESVPFEDDAGPVNVFALPYIDPPEVRNVLCDETLHTHNLAMNAVLEKIRKKSDHKSRSIIVSHSFVAGGEESESERPLSIGGAGTVDASLFSFAHYVALGHLHKPQKINPRQKIQHPGRRQTIQHPGKKFDTPAAGKQFNTPAAVLRQNIQYPGREIHYSGSLLKYSFSETAHHKSVHIVEMDAAGACTITPVHLKPRRDVQCIEGYFDDLKKNPPVNISRDDYLMATLLDQGVIIDVMARLREVYPNLLHIRKPFVEINTDNTRSNAEYRKLGEKELFASFVSQVTGEHISAAQLKEFEKVQEIIKTEGRSE